MRNRVYRLAVAFACVCTAGVAFFLSGCEEGGGDSLGVSPNYVTIGPNITTYQLTVVSGMKDLSYPLEWSVANASLGRIASHSGNWAIYARTEKHGVNSVMVLDQYGAEGIASVNQVNYTTAVPGTTTNTTTNTTTPTNTTTTTTNTTTTTDI